MKRTTIRTILILCLMELVSANLLAQEQTEKKQTKKITTDNQVWASPFKSQGTGGSCYVFSVISFLESEIYRSDKKKIELSEMYCHYYSYIEKIQKCIRLRIPETFTGGGHFEDVLKIIEKYGAMPYYEYEGTKGKKDINNYEALYPEIKQEFLVQLFENAGKNELNINWDNGVVTNPWLTDLKQILDTNMGAFPNTFKYNRKLYTPKQFALNVLKLPLNDYIKLTSYSYIPFYQTGELLVKDNWLHANDFYSLPVNEFISTIDNAINNNYSLVVDIHITEELYANITNNYADYMEDDIINQDVRDELFDNWLTSDIHLFHLIGIAYDETGKKYYLIKDSVGKELGFENPPIFFSENYFKARALAVMVHKDGIPKNIKRKLNIN